MRSRLVLAFLLALALPGSRPLFAQTAGSRAHKPKSPAAMEMTPWFSLEPEPGITEARLGLRAEAPPNTTQTAKNVETITVFGKRRAPTEEALHQDAPEAESWQSDAAQPFVPRPGESCTYKSGCFDPQQKGLFSTLPSLFGGD